MVDLSVQWLGLELRSPLVVGASPLSDTAALAHRLVAAGVGPIGLTAGEVIDAARRTFNEWVATIQTA